VTICAGGNRLGAVVSKEELILRRAVWEQKGMRLVLARGRFDLLHPGHIRLLQQARSLGEVLVVVLESDSGIQESDAENDSASRMKHLPRLINPASERAEILAALSAVDFVLEQEDSSEQSLLEWLSPDIVVTGARKAQAPCPSPVESSAKINLRKTVWIRIPLEPGYSTASVLERIRQIPT
jgi:cytidyltransferase-like protein